MYTDNTGAGANFTIMFTGDAPPPPPFCGCGAIAVTQDKGAYYCAACLEQENRQRAIACAEEWLTGAFLAVPCDRRPRVYKQLSLIYHPDQGADPRLMFALNNVRDRFC
jgi:hypothetical protein